MLEPLSGRCWALPPVRTAISKENNYIVSWCVGHLVGLADASSYDERFAKWRYSDLPIVPDEWLFEVPKDKQKQFKVLRDLMLDKRVTELVCATRCGARGRADFPVGLQESRLHEAFQAPMDQLVGRQSNPGGLCPSAKQRRV